MTSGCTGGGGGGTGTVVAGAGGSSNGPCGACKYLRRKCVEGCVFAPYFDTEQGSAHFAAVHRVFGASNASKLLLRIPPQRRFDAVVTLCYEALARVRDPIYGCVSHIFSLQQQVVNLQAELANIQARLSTIQRLPAHQLQQPPPPPVSSEPPTSPPQQPSLNTHRPSIISSTLNSTITPLASSFDPQQALLPAGMDTGDLPESLLDDDDGSGCSDLHTLSSELIYKYFSGAKFCSSE